MENLSELCVGMTVEHREKNEISIPLAEYRRLIEIKTRFEVLQNEMIHASYCPIHHQIILGIEDAYAKKSQELKTDLLPENLKKQEGE